MILGVDFDGTLSLGKWPECGPPNHGLIEFLLLMKQRGASLILWTCRAGEALEEAVRWCRKQGLDFDAVNDNLPQIVEYYGCNSRKIFCDYYIDDKGIAENLYKTITKE